MRFLGFLFFLSSSLWGQNFSLQGIFYKKESASLNYDKRFATQLAYEQSVDPLIFGMHTRIAPDFNRKAQELTYDQHLYSLFLTCAFPWKAFFTFLPQIGVGTQWSHTHIVVDQVNHNVHRFSPVLEGAFRINYALSEEWSVGYQIFTTYDLLYGKQDWGHGGGVSFLR